MQRNSHIAQPFRDILNAFSAGVPPTKSLIPTNGIHITENQNPNGFYVARYDGDGFTSAPRWFPTLEKAQAYAKQIG